MASITFSCDGQTIRISLEDAAVTIGRDAESYVFLSDKSVSMNHAQIIRDEKKWLLHDRKSRNGTFLNGHRVLPDQPVQLQHENEIRIGPYQLAFENEEELSDRHLRELLAGIQIDENSDSSIQGSASATGYGLLSVRPEEKLNGILRINEALAGNVDFRAICPRMLDELFKIFPQADRGAILFLQNDGNDLIPVAQRRRNPDDTKQVLISRAIVDLALREKNAILSHNTPNDSEDQGSDPLTPQATQSTMCAPMIGLDGKPFGIISLDSRDRKNHFGDGDLQLLLAVANQASHVFENARLLTSHLEKLRQDEVMKISAQVQRALIPEILPQPPRYRFYGSYDAAQVVGGDYFDCFEMPNGKICVSFGDVSGKGFPAALIMSRLSGIVRSMMTFADDVGLAMCQINKLMCNNMVEGKYVTYILGVIDPVNHLFEYANAGHMPPEVRHPEGRLSNAGIEKSGLPIGINPDCQYETSSLELAAGTMVLLRTDGVDDAMSLDGTFYGSERWRAVLAAAHADPETIGQGLRADVKLFSTGQKQHDDIAILAFGRLS